MDNNAFTFDETQRIIHEATEHINRGFRLLTKPGLGNITEFQGGDPTIFAQGSFDTANFKVLLSKVTAAINQLHNDIGDLEKHVEDRGQKLPGTF
jgi:hypothetical protein